MLSEKPCTCSEVGVINRRCFVLLVNYHYRLCDRAQSTKVELCATGNGILLDFVLPEGLTIQ